MSFGCTMYVSPEKVIGAVGRFVVRIGAASMRNGAGSARAGTCGMAAGASNGSGSLIGAAARIGGAARRVGTARTGTGRFSSPKNGSGFFRGELLHRRRQNRFGSLGKRQNRFDINDFRRDGRPCDGCRGAGRDFHWRLRRGVAEPLGDVRFGVELHPPGRRRDVCRRAVRFVVQPALAPGSSPWSPPVVQSSVVDAAALRWSRCQTDRVRSW